MSVEFELMVQTASLASVPIVSEPLSTNVVLEFVVTLLTISPWFVLTVTVPAEVRSITASSFAPGTTSPTQLVAVSQ